MKTIKSNFSPEEKYAIWEARLVSRKDRAVFGWRGDLAVFRNAEMGILFSDEDADLRRVSWSRHQITRAAAYAMNSTTFRAGAGLHVNIHVTAQRVVLRRIMGRALRADEYADHINFNTFDNRRENLRPLNPKQSANHKQKRQ